MKFKLLIIDDELDEIPPNCNATRRNCYLQLEDKFEVVFVENPGELNGALRTKGIHGILLDFDLSRWGAELETVLARLDDDYPIALISSRWAPNFEKLRGIFDRYRNRIGQLFTWDDLQHAEPLSLVKMWLEIIIRRSRDIALTGLSERDPIRILHLSDLQFGSDLPPDFDTETELIAQALRRHWGAPPHFVALTGDVAEHGLPNEFASANTWINKFLANLAGNNSTIQLLSIPGNHDICWPLGWSAHIDVKKKALTAKLAIPNAGLQNFALAPFRNFAAGLQRESDWSGERHYWTFSRYRHEGIAFFGCNTSEDLDEWCCPTRKMVDSTVAEMFSTLRAQLKDAEGTLIVGLLHHPLTQAGSPGDMIVNRSVLFKNLSIADSTVVLLTGHVHGDGYCHGNHDGIDVLEIAASTATKPEPYRPADTNRGFNLLELSRSGGRVSGLHLAFCRMERSAVVVAKEASFRRGADNYFSSKRR